MQYDTLGSTRRLRAYACADMDMIYWYIPWTFHMVLMPTPGSIHLLKDLTCRRLFGGVASGGIIDPGND